jgi:hypothetical protein
MTDLILKNKSKMHMNSIEEYITSWVSTSGQNINHVKTSCKINDENIVLPTFQNYRETMKPNYNLNQLKTFAKYYKMKVSGNKTELFTRIFGFLHLSFYIIKLQKHFRGFLRRKYNTLRGPACKNRKLCTNQVDFVTMELVEEISYNQFISYEDVDKFIYGFDISSLYNMIIKHQETKNPYNRNNIPDWFIKNIKTIIRFSKILNSPINLTIEDDSKNVSIEKTIELKALSLFQSIDSLGHYSNSQWFLSLNRNQIIRYIRELGDIWNYRVQLSMPIKCNICPPYGDPFRNLSMHYIQTEQNISNVQKVVLDVLDKFVMSGVDRDSKHLGASYVLGALTLVNESAATALPWLYESFSYF